jgi:undecaprenyl-diphosphatase
LIGYLDHIDRAIFLFLNGFHNLFFDGLMFWITRGLLWIPLSLVFLYFLFREWKWNALIIFAFAAIMVLASDQLSFFAKETVQRLRPSQQPGLMVHMVEAYKGGTYGFYSAHASNTMCVAFFLFVLIGRKYWYVCALALVWSLVMSYTRIYLGVHYPGDILTGWIAGAILGLLCGKGTKKLILFMEKKKNADPAV